MKRRGFEVRTISCNGPCLFRSVSLLIYGDENSHGIVRERAMDYIEQNRHYFENFITEDFDKYVRRKRFTRTYGNHVEIQALCEVYNRTIEIYSYEATPTYVAHPKEPRPGVPPLRLSYECNNHYNAIVRMDEDFNKAVTAPVNGTDKSKEMSENVTNDVSTGLTSDTHALKAQPKKESVNRVVKNQTSEPTGCEQQQEQAQSIKSQTVPKSSKGRRGRPRRGVNLNRDTLKRQAPQETDDACPPAKRCRCQMGITANKSSQTIESSFTDNKKKDYKPNSDQNQNEDQKHENSPDS
ncbi:OTU domain-containing protein 5-like [Drosophila tropicalis]|uniref:OTU domain-containing protein 5-like n=1 Tax=Drosophila tropicalis TaxID=46794 RepID=UPI0035AC206D